MIRQHVAALLAYADRLDPTRAAASAEAALERLDQWCELLSDVPPTAPHPDGRDWNAAQVVRHHIATSPYPIKPSDVSRPWHDFKGDVLRRHVDPVPAVDPDDQAAYTAALLGTRHAIATGERAATFRPAELTHGTAAERDAEAQERLAALGTYMPRTVKDQFAAYRPRRAQRERLAAANQPDPLDVTCVWCGAETGEQCRDRRINPRTQALAMARRTKSHPSRIDAATARHNARTEAAV
ncbi:cell surface glycoprotein [Streptomyces sp. NPDC058394]|uniref:zinc finger domain-containing protein n=1 Tax=Streptomyces sp. NPDC058394 TaxID=3346477 RepID=UPI0036630A30